MQTGIVLKATILDSGLFLVKLDMWHIPPVAERVNQ